MKYKDVEKLPHLFEELTPEADKTAQMFALGYEQKEIADIKCRSISTIRIQIDYAKKALNVRNGRELTIRYAEKISGFNISDKARSFLSVVLLCVFMVGFSSNINPRRQQRRTTTRITRIMARRSDIELII